MGLLDNDSSIITVDAVLTALGRDRISQNNGSFEVVRFTFGDDEIDYSLFVAQTGTLQQDSNILNTPIFEASTYEKSALKFPLISISNPDLKYMPTLASSVVSLTLGERTDSQVGKTLEFKQTIQGGRIVPAEILDASFQVQIINDLLFIEKNTPVSVSPNGILSYIIPRTSINVSQGGQVAFNVAVAALTTTTWDYLGSGTKPNRTISTKVRCTGLSSGLSNDVTITISEEFTR